MLRLALPIFCAVILTCCAIAPLQAQTPEFLKIDSRAQFRTPEATCTGAAKAGSTTRTLSPKSKSNDKHFLCLGDSLLIKHNGNQNLSEDPNAATLPGIAYIFYKCPPTVGGPRLIDIKTDPCIETKPINGVPPPGGFYLARDKASGDATFVNNKNIQNTFNGGAPVKYYFAPFTLYNYFSAPNPDAEGDTACVNVNIADGTPLDTFSVVYLNAIQLLNPTVNGLSGSFTALGGLSQYDGSPYTVTIVNQANAAIVGTVTGNPVHNNKISFTVPIAGSYLVSITDGKSCGYSQVFTLPSVSFAISTESVSSGDTACVSFKVANFNNIASFQFGVKYESNNLKLVSLNNSGGLVPALDLNSTVHDDGVGDITFGWNANSGGVTKPDSSILFTLCFKAIGPNGIISPVVFKDSIAAFDVTTADGISTKTTHTDGSVRIGLISYSLTARTDSTLCSGDTTGKIRLIPIGNGAPFSYTYVNTTNPLIKGAGTIAANDSAIISKLPTGQYTISVLNSSNEKRDTTVSIKTPNVIFINPPTAVNPKCFGDKNGSLTLATFGGGTQPYSFKWSNNATTVGISNLASGTYSCVLTDFHQCQASTSGSIGVNPIAISNKNIIGALCAGKNNGSATFNLSGGTTASGNYKISLNGGAAVIAKSGNFNNLAPGNYQLAITDGNSCVLQDSFTVSSTRTLTANAVVSNITCKGLNNGFISIVIAANGSEKQPYIFNWAANAGVPVNNGRTSSVNKLASGKYTITVFDADGCKIDTAYSVTEPDSVKISLLSSRNESCTVGTDGEINVGANGGTPYAAPRFYQYKWSRLASDTLSILSKVKGGSYTITVSDAQGCTATKSFTITSPTFPKIDSFSVKAATCSEKQDGKLKVFAHATTLSTTIKGYKWSNGGIADTIINLSAGKYYVTVTSSDGCPKSDSAIIKAPQPIKLDSLNFSKVDPTCPKSSTGKITLVVKGGTPPYKYNWSAGPTTNQPIFASLTSGTYSFSVTDTNACTAFETSIVLVEPPTISVNFTNVTKVSCFGKCAPGDATATAIASGGTVNNGLYSFQWSSGETNANTNQSTSKTLCPGMQFVTVTDAQCGTIASLVVGQPDSFQFNSPSITPANCHGDKNGSATVNVKAGSATPPYSYLWSTGSKTNSIVNVAGGRYTVLITDANSCPYNYTVFIDQPDSLKLDTVGATTHDVSCFGLQDGAIELQKIGGNDGNVNYNWRPNVSTTNKAQGLSSGSYSVTLTDSRGCTDSLTQTISQPDKIYFFLSPIVAARCAGDLNSVRLDTAFGSTYKHQFYLSVDNGPQFPIGNYVPVIGGAPHNLTIQEQFTGCYVDTTVFVPEPPPITVTFNTPELIDKTALLRIGLGDSVKLDSNFVKVTTALPLDSVSWSPTTFLRFGSSLLYPTIRPLDDITYKLTVKDANGCVGSGFLAVQIDRNRNVFIPLVFSPNNDDVNDFFAPFSGTGVKNINFFKIFDRWGAQLYDKENFPPTSDPALYGWDGSFRGSAVPVGVYVYVVQVLFEDGQTLLYRGDITLVR